MNSINLVARVASTPSFAFVGQTNRPLLKFLVTFTRKVKTDSTRIIELAVVIWGNKAEAAHALIKQDSTVAISGEIDFDSFTQDKDHPARHRTVIVTNTIRVLGTHEACSSSQPV